MKEWHKPCLNVISQKEMEQVIMVVSRSCLTGFTR